MMEQYLRIKEQHKDALLFFRLGDFYEMFYEDAKTASAAMEITLTTRQKVPMCGVPYHAADTYLARLLKKGFKVAICEQVEDPKQATGVVKRDVVKILTPGTAVELELQDGKEGSTVAGIYLNKEDWGLALIDLANGDIEAMQSDEVDRKNLSDELFRSFPREILYPQDQENSIRRALSLDNDWNGLMSGQEDWTFDEIQARNELLGHFRVSSLSGFGLEGKDLAVRAAGALLYYLKTLRKDSLSFIRHISYIHSHRHMTLDASSIRNLELVRNLRDGRSRGSFLDVIDATVTAMGGRLLRYWLLHPLLDGDVVHRRQDAVQDLLERTIERRDLRERLKGISDLGRLTGKIALSAANARDLVALRKSLQPLCDIRKILDAFSSPDLEDLRDDWDSAPDLIEFIQSSIREEPAILLTEGGLIADGFNSELDELRNISRSGKTFITELEKKEREQTGISTLKVKYNKVFGYYIEITKSHLAQVPEHYMRKQTLVNAERFITPELKEYEQKVLHAEERIGELEHKLFLEIRAGIGKENERLQAIAARLSRLDVLSGLAEISAQRNYRRPLVDGGDRIDIRNGRHPVIEYLNDEPFIPNDTYLDQKDNQIQIVTGPNMGGKSTFLRQVALICILAQMGSFVPAESAEVGIVDRIFTRIGAMDFLSIGHSTFMVEMLETANILNNATPKSLILLDEIGRGTSTFDGLSIAWAVAEYLHDHEPVRAKTLFATHYHELTELSLTMGRIKNLHVSVREQQEEIVFLRKIVPGPSDQSYGIHVAKLAGIPQRVIERAREILFNLEKKELDDSGQPRIAYRTEDKRNKSQLLLFDEDKERTLFKEIRMELTGMDLSAMTPLEALNRLYALQEKLKTGRD